MPIPDLEGAMLKKRDNLFTLLFHLDRFYYAAIIPLLVFHNNQPFFCLLKRVKRKHLRRSAGNNVEGCFVAKIHMGPHIKARSLRRFNATQLLKPHKELPRRPAIGSCMMERQCP